MRYYCTYFDRNYLLKALNLFDSLNNFEKKPFKVFAVCLDEITRIILQNLDPGNVELIPLHSIESSKSVLLEVKENRSLVEYYWTLTPVIINAIFDRYPEIDTLTYIDSDCYYFSDPQPIYDELNGNSVLIHEHRFSENFKSLEKYGKFNVGLLVFKNDTIAKKILKRWEAQCIEWCYDRDEDGKFGDQKYLDEWPSLDDKVKILQNIAAGVAPWNHIQYSYSALNDVVYINEQPLIFYHFHSMIGLIEGIFIPMKFASYIIKRNILELIYLPYLRNLENNLKNVRTIVPEFHFGVKTGTKLTPDLMFLARSELRGQILSAGIPHKLVSLSEDWDCFTSNQLIEDF